MADVAMVSKGKLTGVRWFLLNDQFWPKVSFGIGTVTAPFGTLTECLMKPYYQLLSVVSKRG
jgi:hypothetical protein